MFKMPKSAPRTGVVSLLLLLLVLAAGPAAAQWSDATTPALADATPSHGVSWADFDLDGDLDIYLANNGVNKLFRNGGEDPGNPGQWLWANVAPVNGTGIGSSQVSSVGVWGDYDNDGDPDLYLANTQGANHLFRNDPVNPGLPDDPNRAFVDVTNSLVLGSTRATHSSAWVDYDNDGDLDLYMCDAISNFLLRNDGADPQAPGFTTFTDVTAATGTTSVYDSQGVAWADYDRDGDQDLFIANYNGPSQFLRNDPQTPSDPDDPDRVFVNVTAAAGLTHTGPSRGASWGDFDNDGDADLYLTNYGTANRLYRNDGGVFLSIGVAAGVADAGNGRHCCWVDYDNDADLDLWVTNYDNGIVTQDSRLYRNDGPDGLNPDGWLFVDAADALLANDLGLGSSAGWADYDADGDLDMYFVNWNADHPNKLVRNDLATGADYLHLDLAGRLSNASAIGARVRVVTGHPHAGPRDQRRRGLPRPEQPARGVRPGPERRDRLGDRALALGRGPAAGLRHGQPAARGRGAGPRRPGPGRRAGLHLRHDQHRVLERRVRQRRRRVPRAGRPGHRVRHPGGRLGLDRRPLARVHRPVRRAARPLPGPRARRGRHRLALVGLGGLAPGRRAARLVAQQRREPAAGRAVQRGVPGHGHRQRRGLGRPLLPRGPGPLDALRHPDRRAALRLHQPRGPGHLRAVLDRHRQHRQRGSGAADARRDGRRGAGALGQRRPGRRLGRGQQRQRPRRRLGRLRRRRPLRPVHHEPAGLVPAQRRHRPPLPQPGPRPGRPRLLALPGRHHRRHGRPRLRAGRLLGRLRRRRRPGRLPGQHGRGRHGAQPPLAQQRQRLVHRHRAADRHDRPRRQRARGDLGRLRPRRRPRPVPLQRRPQLPVAQRRRGPAQPGQWLFVNVAPTDGTGIGDDMYTMGCSWIDYDNDGDPDLHLANYNNGPDRLFRNDGEDPLNPGQWVFTNVAALMGIEVVGNGMNASWGDYDNDGWLDFYLANDGPNRLYHRVPGVDHFEDVTAVSGAGLGDPGYTTGTGWADYDNDGDLDLYVGNHWTDATGDWVPNHLFRNDGEDPLNPGRWVFTDVAPAGGAGIGAGENTTATAWADYDNDGDLDVYLCNMSGTPNFLFRNDVPDAQTNHWLQLDLVSLSANTSAIGARVRCVVGGTSMIREVEGITGFLSQNSLTVEFGLGAAAVADSVLIRWPSGIEQNLVGVAAGQRLEVIESGPGRPVLAALPAITAGDSLVLAWNPVSGEAPVTYQAELAADAAFTQVLADSGWIAGTSHVFTGLADGFTGFYRVRSRDAALLVSLWSNTVTTRQDASPPASAVDPVVVAFQGLPFDVTATAADAVSGVARVDLWYRHGDDQGPFTLFGSTTDGSPFFFDLPDSLGMYYFYTTSADSAGNEEPAPAGWDQSVLVTQPQWVLVSPADGSGVGNDGNGRGVAWGDYDRDGDHDLYITNRIVYQNSADATSHLFRNDGADPGEQDSWLFADVSVPPMTTPGYGQGVAWGDFDGDGDLDLYQTYMQVSEGTPAPNRLYRNDGAGVFTEIGVETGTDDGGSGRSCSWADYDQDGDLDLYLCNNGANRLYRNDGLNPEALALWVFTNVAPADSTGIGDGSYTMGCAWGDYDNDGDPDLYLANYNEQPDRLFRNDGPDPRNAGEWLFTDVAAEVGLVDTGSGLGCAWGDFDNDGLLDLYVTNDGPNFLYHNVSVGVATGKLGRRPQDAGDNAAEKAAPTIQFVDIAPMYDVGLDDGLYGSGIGWADYDNDGDLDLYMGNHWNANGDPAPNRMFRNDGPDEGNAVGWLFSNAAPTHLGLNIADDSSTNGVAWADYDGDGDLDLYMASMMGVTNKLFRNDVADSTGNHWLQLDLSSPYLNTCAIGARVRVVAGGLSMIREVDGGSGFLSQGSLTVEFGLGAAAVADSVEILWPDGYHHLMLNVPGDQRLLVSQPQTAIDDDGPAPTPLAFRVYDNFPNPFNPSTTIRLDLPISSRVRLGIYAVDGSLVRTLFDEELPAGTHQAVWDGRDRKGGRVASGVYFYRVETSGDVVTRKMLLVK
ncbi:MAG: VCBS repeat-containing protein [bacterium]|nr:VCBS repeat-containing protein [bacterium]